jgi:hypothetical protein
MDVTEMVLWPDALWCLFMVNDFERILEAMTRSYGGQPIDIWAFGLFLAE